MDLDGYRNRINEIDDQIIALFAERMQTAAKIAETKAAQNLPVLDSEREEAVLRHVREKAGKELEAYAETLYQTMFRVSRSYQAKLMSMERTDIPDAKPTCNHEGKESMKLLVLNGPNINMLGIREKNIYGEESYESLCRLLEKTFLEKGIAGEVFQSNHEGALVDRIQAAYFDGTNGIIINPAAFTHTSIAILDALKAVNLPAVEVHLSDIAEREDFRQVSYAGMACVKTIKGKGFQGYVEAVCFLADYISLKTDEKK